MSDVDPTPDDLLVSAVLDGEASPEEVERVASDPRLAARLEQLRLVARAVGGPVLLVDPVVREAHLAAAVAEARRLFPPAADEVPLVAAAAVAPPPPPPPASPTPPPPVDLAAARARRRRPVGTVILSVAAGVLVLGLVAAGLARVASQSGSTSDEAASTAQTAADEAGDASAGGADAARPEAQDDSSALGDGGQATPSTVPGSTSSATEAGVDPTLPSLGTFTKAEDLTAAVRGRLVLDPTPDPAGEDPTCQDDFPVATTLLGRATVAGEEGLVYVDTEHFAGRQMWFVDPATPGADGEACRRIVPVATL